MKVTNIARKSGETSQAYKTSVKNGFIQRFKGELMDADLDTQSDKRQNVKEYIEQRYNAGNGQQVFSAGTFTTLKAKAALSDVARTHSIPSQVVKYVTKAISDDKASFTDLFKIASRSRKLRDFIMKNPMVIEDLRAVLGNQKSTSVHASAIIPTPAFRDGEKAECFDYLPIRKMDSLLVSEFDGYDCDAVGLLKIDALNTKELTKLSRMFKIVKDVYGEDLSLERIEQDLLEDPEVYECFQKGYTQDIFQFGSDGITKLTVDISPKNIFDLSAINALYRPATIEIGSTEAFGRYKRGEVEPEYMWGTYEATKDTYSLLVYQEQLALIANQVGGLSLADGVKLVKYISKKKVDKIIEYKEKFVNGAIKNGCPEDEAKNIWSNFEAAGSYLFNKCIAGSETIYRHQKQVNPKLYAPTIEEMYLIRNDISYAKMHNKIPLRSKYMRKGYGIAYSLNEDGKLVMNRIKDIKPAGFREVFKITLEDGKTIKVTDNHKFPTQRGEVKTSDLIIGEDMLYVNIGHVHQDTGYRFTDKGKDNSEYHSHASPKVAYEVNAEPGHCGFMKRDTSYTRNEHYRLNLMKKYCENCGVEGKRLEAHHVDGDHGNNDLCNLVTYCVSCHKKAHYAMGRTTVGKKGLFTDLRKIVSIESAGKERVYDVSMENPYHTYTTKTGIVTCNSHSTAYSLLSYAGMYIKCHYPTAFYTVALEFCSDDDIPILMGEMDSSSKCKIVPPDINKSMDTFTTDYTTNQIFWSLSRIKFVGSAATSMICSERKINGNFKSFADFIDRMDKYVEVVKQQKKENGDSFTNPLNFRCIKNMIISGCFDKVEGLTDTPQRYNLIKQLHETYNRTISETEFPPSEISKAHFWSRIQVALSSIGSTDYKRVLDLYGFALKAKNVSYHTFEELLDIYEPIKRSIVVGTIEEIEEKAYKDKTTGENKLFAKITLSENHEQLELIIWDNCWSEVRDAWNGKQGSIVMFVGHVNYSEFNGCNVVQLNKGNSFDFAI